MRHASDRLPQSAKGRQPRRLRGSATRSRRPNRLCELGWLWSHNALAGWNERQCHQSTSNETVCGVCNPQVALPDFHVPVPSWNDRSNNRALFLRKVLADRQAFPRSISRLKNDPATAGLSAEGTPGSTSSCPKVLATNPSPMGGLNAERQLVFKHAPIPMRPKHSCSPCRRGAL